MLLRGYGACHDFNVYIFGHIPHLYILTNIAETSKFERHFFVYGFLDLEVLFYKKIEVFYCDYCFDIPYFIHSRNMYDKTQFSFMISDW